jgi:hypothetical protein
VIEVRVCDQNRIRRQRFRKVVTQPHAARIRVDEDATAPGGMDAEAGVRDRLDRHLTRLRMEPSIGRNVSHRDPWARHVSFSTEPEALTDRVPIRAPGPTVAAKIPREDSIVGGQPGDLTLPRLTAQRQAVCRDERDWPASGDGVVEFHGLLRLP